MISLFFFFFCECIGGLGRDHPKGNKLGVARAEQELYHLVALCTFRNDLETVLLLWTPLQLSSLVMLDFWTSRLGTQN